MGIASLFTGCQAAIERAALEPSRFVLASKAAGAVMIHRQVRVVYHLMDADAVASADREWLAGRHRLTFEMSHDIALLDQTNAAPDALADYERLLLAIMQDPALNGFGEVMFHGWAINLDPTGDYLIGGPVVSVPDEIDLTEIGARS